MKWNSHAAFPYTSNAHIKKTYGEVQVGNTYVRKERQIKTE